MKKWRAEEGRCRFDRAWSMQEKRNPNLSGKPEARMGRMGFAHAGGNAEKAGPPGFSRPAALAYPNRIGTRSRPTPGHGPEGEPPYALAKEEPPEAGFLRDDRRQILQKEQRQVAQIRHICPLKHMIHMRSAQQILFRCQLCHGQHGRKQDPEKHTGLFQICNEGFETQAGFGIRRFPLLPR